MDRSTRRITTDDGVALAVHEWGERGDAPPVVLQHGFAADSITNWELTGVVEALVAAGRRVVALDARGHGDSEKPHDPARYGEARMAEDLGGCLDDLGVAAADLVGYSMGAVVALVAATRDPRIRRLAVGGVGAAVVELGGVDTRVLDNRALAAALRADDPATVDDARARDVRSMVDALGGDRLALAAQADVVHATSVPLERIRAPTLVLAGADDELAARPEVLVAAIPDARLARLAGDHLAAVLDPRFATVLVEFLA